MKKTFLVLICMCCLTVSSFPVYAAASDSTLTYGLSSDGKNAITVETGDVITVAYTITSSAVARTSTTQNQIDYDHHFFELVEGSNGVEGEYGAAFATSTPVDSDGSHYIYYNSVSSVIFKKDTVATIGTFKLKVIGTSGQSSVNNTAFFATDKDAKMFGSDKQDLTVTIKGSSKHVHKAVKQEGVKATKDSAGYKEYYKCDCNKYFEDEECTKEITDRVAWKAPGGNGYIAPLTGNILTEDTAISRVLRVALILLAVGAVCGILVIMKRRNKKEK